MSILEVKKAKCSNCYKCIRVCPVKSIAFTDGRAEVIPDECILCGRCVVACPQNAKKVQDDIGTVKAAIASGREVVASAAPSFISEFNVSGIEQFEEILKQMGFAYAGETAEGAYVVKSRYEEIINNHEQDVIISSCCHTVTKLIQKYYPLALPYYAKVISPMQAHAQLIKERDPDAFVVFIGPCISKKDEAQQYAGNVDCVLTFEEMRGWLAEHDIFCEIPAAKCGPDDTIQYVRVSRKDGKRSRFFPKAGGIINSMKTNMTGYRYIAVDGIEKCIEALKEIISGNIHHCFVEMSACVDSCIGGPATARHKEHVIDCNHRVENYSIPPRENYNAIDEELADFVVAEKIDTSKEMESEYIDAHTPSEHIIKEILAKMGKRNVLDELNCGSCGYDTCREKAIAVYKGKANVEMCLPFMKERAESFSDNIIMMTPNGIMVLDEDLKIQQINLAACNIFNIKNPELLKDTPIVELIDPTPFINALMTGKQIMDEQKYIPEYNKYVEMSLVYEKEHRLLICILKDITERELENERVKKLREKTAEVTDGVIQKQMRVVQEIASLLGETTAETKIALTTLKNTMNSEDL